MKKSLIAGASVFALIAGLGTAALADDVSNVRVKITDDGGIDMGKSDFKEDAISLNTQGQKVENTMSLDDEVLDDDGDYDADIIFGDETYRNQKVNINNVNTGINAGQQGGIAVSVDENDDTGAISMNVLNQFVENDTDAETIVDETADYDAEIIFKDLTFESQKVNVNNLNTGIDDAQQGGIAVAVSGYPGDCGDCSGYGQADVDKYEVDITDHGDIDAKIDDVDSDAFAGNIARQEVNNDVDLSSDDGLEDWGEYHAEIHFGHHTFNNQTVNVNNMNTGINVGQQGGLAVAADMKNDDGAVAVNVLSQVVTNSFGNYADDLVNDRANYWANVEFGDYTFKNQKVNVNNINTGINAAQQGGIAIATSSQNCAC